MALAVADHGHLSPKAAPRGIASIMVHVDFDSDFDDRIRIASDLADRFGAVLIGVTEAAQSNRDSAARDTGMMAPKRRP